MSTDPKTIHDKLHQLARNLFYGPESALKRALLWRACDLIADHCLWRRMADSEPEWQLGRPGAFVLALHFPFNLNLNPNKMKLNDPFDDQDPAECPHCGALMEAEADCDIDPETGAPSVCGVVSWCPNDDCKEGSK